MSHSFSADPSTATERKSAEHNTSVDQPQRQDGVCAQLHLATGRMCTLPHAHADTCEFVPPDEISASLLRLRELRA